MLSGFNSQTGRTNTSTTLLSLGDSMADSEKSIAVVIMNRMGNLFGFTGISLNNWQNNSLYVVTNGAKYLPVDNIWFSDHFILPPGSALWWYKLYYTGYWCDRVGVFYVSQPLGGTMQISISTNGGPWGGVLTIDGYSPTPAGHYTNVVLNRNYHRLRVDGLTGTNYVIGGPDMTDSTATGIKMAFLDRGGIALSDMTNVPMSIRQPILKALNPQLIMLHMKEDSSLGTSNGLLNLEEWFSNSVPSSAIVYIGTPYCSTDTNSPGWTPAQNAVFRKVAVDHNRVYVDCMTPSVSYAWQVAQGYMVDSAHEDLAGSTYLAGFAWRQLFFWVGAPRTIAISRTAPGIVAITAPTLAGLTSTLESSSNRVNWTAVCTSTNGATISTNVPAGSASQWYRLHLTP